MGSESFSPVTEGRFTAAFHLGWLSLGGIKGCARQTVCTCACERLPLRGTLASEEMNQLIIQDADSPSVLSSIPAAFRSEGKQKTKPSQAHFISFHFHGQGTKRLCLGPAFLEDWDRICASEHLIRGTPYRSRVGRRWHGIWVDSRVDTGTRGSSNRNMQAEGLGQKP